MLTLPARLLLLALTWLAAAAAGAAAADSGALATARHYYCSPSGKPVLLEGSKHFVLHTLYEGTEWVSAGTNCTFQTVPTRFALSSSDDYGGGYKYLVEVLAADVLQDETFLEVLDNAGHPRRQRWLFHESNMHWTRYLAVSWTDRLRVTFLTSGSYPSNSSTGYRIRLRRFAKCPPGDWSLHGDYCFSPSSDRLLRHSAAASKHQMTDIASAQLVCNRMRANLLMATPPVLDATGVTRLNSLSYRLGYRVPLWIGLTDNTVSGQGKLYWLNGTPLSYKPDWVCCQSGYSCTTEHACQPTERYVYLRPTPMSFLVFAPADTYRHFACFMEAYGATELYPVRLMLAASSEAGDSAVIPIVLACGVLTFVGIIAIVLVRRSRRRLKVGVADGNARADERQSILIPQAEQRSNQRQRRSEQDLRQREQQSDEDKSASGNFSSRRVRTRDNVIANI